MAVRKGLIFLLLLAQWAVAESLDFEAQWSGWVKDRHPAIDCPINISNDGKKVCVWPGKLELDVSDSGMSFKLPVEVYKKQAFIVLPGDLQHWPIRVSINGEFAPVVEKNNRPGLFIDKGEYLLSGEFSWESKPSYLAIPQDISLVILKERGKEKTVNHSGGKIFFDKKQQATAARERDSLRVEVYRLLSDGLPLTLESRVKLFISGKSREVLIGRLAFEGTEVMSVDSQLPSRIETDGNLRVQVRPGEHYITVKSRFIGNPESIASQKTTESWPSFEYLSFKSDTDIRQAKLSGAASIDTSQVAIPYDWQDFPTYRLDEKSVLNIETEQRGDKASASNQLHVSRNIWLDFNGEALTSLDSIEGKMTQQWRLNTQGDTALGRATVAGKSVLITDEKGKKGIEIRSPNINVSAVSRVDNPSDFSAVGWDARAESFDAVLHLPPGWRVLFADGVDNVTGVWLKQWDLWDVFLVLILIAATHKLMGIKVSVIAAVTLIVTYHEGGSPVVIWPIMLLIIALLPLLNNRLYRITSVVGILTAMMLIMMTVSFSISAFRLAIYPSLEKHRVSHYEQSYYSSGFAAGAPMQQESLMANESKRAKAKQAYKKMKPASSAVEDNLSLSEVPVIRDMYEVDENDRIQTGPGLPTWMWSSVRLSSSGPVSANQRIHVIYSSPAITSIWRITSVALIGVFAFVLILRLSMLIKVEKFSGAAVSVVSLVPLLLAAMFLISPDKVLADGYPPKYLLEELEQKLTKKPACNNQCVSHNNGRLLANKSELILAYDVYAQTDIALKLPKWQWNDVKLNGRAVVVKAIDNNPFVLIQKGHHRINLTGNIISDQFSLSFPYAIHNFTVEADNWTVDGLVDSRLPNNSLNFSAIAQAQVKKSDTLMPDAIKPFVIVKRELFLEKRWRLVTRVERLAPSVGAITVNVPLLEGEKVLSDLHIKDGLATIQLGVNQHSKVWRSSFEPKDKMQWLAVEQESMLETWRIRPSSLWRVEYKGIPPIKEQGDSSSLQPYWKPWPGEKLDLTITRPEGIKGPVQTVENAELIFYAGKHLQKSVLKLSVRSSQGESYEIGLPEDAEILKLMLDGKSLNIPSNNKVKFQLKPGLQDIELEFQQDTELGIMSETPQVKLPGSSANIKVQYNLPRDRWPLYLSGPDIGPAMLYWGVLCVILIAAILLFIIARETQLEMPVKLLDWLLLGIGLSTINGYGVIFIALFFFALAIRKQKLVPDSLSRFQFNAMQLLLLFLTVATVISLVSAIPLGLLSTPDMKVVGNGSYSYVYNFYQDRALASSFPSATIYSVSLMSYRLVMLLWSLWLATRLITWAQWWWSSFSEGVVWKDKDDEQA